MAREKEIEIQTRLGLRTVNTERVIYFPRGLAGFEGLHEFIILQIRPEAPFLVLQSMDKPDVGLLVADPYIFLQEYKVKVGEAEQKLLRVQSEEELAVLVTVSIPQGKPEETSLNLVGPILVNHAMRIGLQVPQADNAALAQYLIHDGTRVHKTDLKESTSREDTVEAEKMEDESQ